MLIYDKPLKKVAAQLRVEIFSEKKAETTLIFSLSKRLRPTQTRKFSKWQHTFPSCNAHPVNGNFSPANCKLRSYNLDMGTRVIGSQEHPAQLLYPQSERKLSDRREGNTKTEKYLHKQKSKSEKLLAKLLGITRGISCVFLLVQPETNQPFSMVALLTRTSYAFNYHSLNHLNELTFVLFNNMISSFYAQIPFYIATT